MTALSIKEEKFVDLMRRVQACRKCPRMNNSARVLGPGCGSLNAATAFVGEAPGRLGADGTYLPFHGDQSGHNFESFIEQVGISRYKIFVTNAVLCNPKDEQGRNATPTAKEVANCSSFLKEQIDLINPENVVPLGAVALKACSMIEPHSLSLKTSVRKSYKWNGRNLMPLYHPGQRAMVHRSFSNQLADYQFVSEKIYRDSYRRIQTNGKSVDSHAINHKLASVAKRIIEGKPEGITYFALHKIYFLAEVEHLNSIGERLTNSYVIRQKDGPYCTDLHISKLKTMIPELIIEELPGKLKLRLDKQLCLEDTSTDIELSASEMNSLSRTISRYGNLTDSKLKTAAYLRNPMRNLLRREKQLRLNLFNAPVLPYIAKNKNPK